MDTVLDCPECGLQTAGIQYVVNFVFADGVRVRQGGAWKLDCGHELPDILDSQWFTDKGVSEVRDFQGNPLLRWEEAPWR